MSWLRYTSAGSGSIGSSEPIPFPDTTVRRDIRILLTGQQANHFELLLHIENVMVVWREIRTGGIGVYLRKTE